MSTCCGGVNTAMMNMFLVHLYKLTKAVFINALEPLASLDFTQWAAHENANVQVSLP